MTLRLMLSYANVKVKARRKFHPLFWREAQKLYFNPNCICRGLFWVEVMRPTVAVSTVELGAEKYTVLGRLNTSARNCSLDRSVTVKSLWIEKSNVAR